MKKLFLACIAITCIQTMALGFSFNIDKPGIPLVSKAGETSDGYIEVENTSAQVLSFTAYTSDWRIEKNGSKSFHPAGTLKNSCAQWLHLYPRVFTLDPGRKQKVQYVLSAPKDTEGGHYAVVFFETAKPDESKGNVLFSGRIGSIIYHTVEGTERYAVSFVEAGASGYEKSLDINFTLDNRSNVFLTVKPVIAVLDSQGHVVIRKALSRFGIMPEQQLTIAETVSQALSPGTYTMVLTAQYADGEFAVVEREFSVQATQKPLSQDDIRPLIVNKFSPVINGSKMKVFIKAENGNPDFVTAEGKLQVFDGKGQVLQLIELFWDERIPPQSEKFFTKTVEHSLKPGTYKARLELLIENKSTVTEVPFKVR